MGVVIAAVRHSDAEVVMGARGGVGTRSLRTPGYSVRVLAQVVGWCMRDTRREWTAHELAAAVGCAPSTAWLVCTDLLTVGHMTRRTVGVGYLMLHRLSESGIETYRPPTGGPNEHRADGSVS